MSQDQAVIEQIGRNAEKFPPSQAFKSFPSMITLLNRLASYMQKEALFFTNNSVEVERQLAEWKGSDAYKGTVLEFLLDCLTDAAHRREIASLTRQICHALISIYTSEKYPLRRLRYAAPKLIAAKLTRPFRRVEVRLVDINVNAGFEDWDTAAAKAVIANTDADCDTVRLNWSVKNLHSLLRSYFSQRVSTMICSGTGLSTSPKVTYTWPWLRSDRPVRWQTSLCTPSKLYLSCRALSVGHPRKLLFQVSLKSRSGLVSPDVLSLVASPNDIVRLEQLGLAQSHRL